MAITLADMAKKTTDPLKLGVIQTFRDVSVFMDRMPIEDAGTLEVKGYRTKSLPTISRRKVGKPYSSSEGQIEPFSEKAFAFGNNIDIDKVYTKDKNVLIDPRTMNTKMTLEAMAYNFVDDVMNGNPLVNVDQMPGFWYRFAKTTDVPARQKIAAGGLDVSTDATGLTANFNSLIDYLDKLIDLLPGRKADAILLNETLRQRITSAARQLSLFTVTQDQLGREVLKYRNAELIDMGTKADLDTLIIGDAEAQDGSALTGGACTSAYAVRFGLEYWTAFQEYEMDVVDKGELEDGVTYRTVVDWVVGQMLANPRSVARLYGVVAK